MAAATATTNQNMTASTPELTLETIVKMFIFFVFVVLVFVLIVYLLADPHERKVILRLALGVGGTLAILALVIFAALVVVTLCNFAIRMVGYICVKICEYASILHEVLRRAASMDRHNDMARFVAILKSVSAPIVPVGAFLFICCLCVLSTHEALNVFAASTLLFMQLGAISQGRSIDVTRFRALMNRPYWNL